MRPRRVQDQGGTVEPHLIEQRIEGTLERLDELVEEMRTAGRELAEAERKYRTNYAQERMRARAMTGSSGRPTPEKDADNLATLATAAERFDLTIAEQTIAYTREALRATQARLDALRALSAASRSAGA